MKRTVKRFLHEGDYAAEVDVVLTESDDAWAPYLSVEETQKLDRIREALQRGDVKEAARTARVFKLMPVAQ